MNKFSRNILIITALAFCIFSTAAFDGCGGGKSKVTVVPVVNTPIKQEDKRVTRRTVAGLTLQSATAIPIDVDAVADAAFTKVVQDARAAGYGQNLEAHLYTINVKQDCEPSLDGTPGFRTPANDYDGTKYDKHNTLGDETDPLLIAENIIFKKDGIGEIIASEQVLTRRNPDTKIDEPYGTGIICYGTAGEMSNNARYFFEHEFLFDNDREKYDRTVNHGTSGIAHPLIEVTD